MTQPRENVIRERVLPAEPVPTLRLPRDRALVPRACGHCGGGLLDFDESRGETVPGRLVCVLCSRDACWIVRERPYARP